jgi:hypothetical protein
VGLNLVPASSADAFLAVGSALFFETVFGVLRAPGFADFPCTSGVSRSASGFFRRPLARPPVELSAVVGVSVLSFFARPALPVSGPAADLFALFSVGLARRPLLPATASLGDVTDVGVAAGLAVVDVDLESIL